MHTYMRYYIMQVSNIIQQLLNDMIEISLPLLYERKIQNIIDILILQASFSQRV